MDVETRFDRLEQALVRLAEAQTRTETRFEELAQAQARTEARLETLTERVDALAQAQARTEARLETLAQAQARTEAGLLALTQQVGRLSETIGFTLEDLAREVSPAYLAQHYAIHVAQLDRRFFSIDGEQIEVDLYGEGHREGDPVAVVGEVRSRIYGRDVEATVQRVARLAPQLPAAAVVILFGFVIHPSARDAARRLGAIVISSSGRG